MEKLSSKVVGEVEAILRWNNMTAGEILNSSEFEDKYVATRSSREDKRSEGANIVLGAFETPELAYFQIQTDRTPDNNYYIYFVGGGDMRGCGHIIPVNVGGELLWKPETSQQK